jgi:hypothetical protein
MVLKVSTSSGVRRNSPAATFSTRCAALPVPGMARTFEPSSNAHAIRTAAALTP